MDKYTKFGRLYNDMEGKRPASNFLLELSKGPKLKP